MSVPCFECNGKNGNHKPACSQGKMEEPEVSGRQFLGTLDSGGVTFSDAHKKRMLDLMKPPEDG